MRTTWRPWHSPFTQPGHEEDRPSLIAVRTHIGYGSPNKQDQSSAHGEPLGEEELRLTKEKLGWPLEPRFHVPEEAGDHFRTALARGGDWSAEWDARMASYRTDFPDQAREWDRWMDQEPPAGLDHAIPVFSPDPKGVASRAASGTVLNAVAPLLPNLVGGSADLSPSNKTVVKGEPVFQAGAIPWPEHPFRSPGTRDGRHHERHGPSRRAHPLRRDLSHFFGLHASPHSAGRHDGTPGDLCPDPRQHRSGGRRPHPPAH